MMRKLIYVAGPISKGDITHNVARAEDAMLVLMKAGFSVINPMLTCWAGAARAMADHPQRIVVGPEAAGHGGFRDLTHAEWIANCLPMVNVADAVLRLPGESTGADQECAYARHIGIPVYHTVEEVLCL